MKKFLLISLVTLAFTCCKKSRTCSCTSTFTDEYSSVYNNSAYSNVSGTNVSTTEEKITFDNIKKRDMRRVTNCNSRIEKYSTSSMATITGTITVTNTHNFTNDISCTLK